MNGEPDPLVGRTLEGRYRIDSVVGTGGFAVVYRARHLVLKRAVAIKLLRPHPSGKADLRARFEREARVLAALSHPNIVGVTDFGVVDDMPYIVMELAVGELLRQAIDRGPFSLDRALSIAAQILDGLAHAHAEGVVHLDLKPTNVILQRDHGTLEHVKILDFGFAKWFGPAARDDQTPLTMAGYAFGTPGYCAPERLGGQSADARADLYAVGALLFEMITGRPAYPGEGLVAMQHQLEDPIPRVAEARPNLAGARLLDEVIGRALAQAPGDRWPDAKSMQAALEKVRQGRDRRGRGRRSRLALAGAAVCALVAAGLWVVAGRVRLPADEAQASRTAPAVEETLGDTPEAALGTIGGRDPFAESLPEPLATFQRRLANGERIPTAEFRPLYGWVRDHPDDPRPHLLFARAYMRLGWREAALQRYVRAHQVDPECRGDPRMLHDLLILATAAPGGAAAARAAAGIYDPDALPAIDRVVAALADRPDAQMRVRWIRDRIANRG